MPNDAKIGLVIGVGVVIAVAVVFFRKEATLPLTGEATAAVGAPKAAPPKPSAGLSRPVKAKTTSQEARASERSKLSQPDTDVPIAPKEPEMR